MRMRKQFDKEFKAKVARAALLARSICEAGHSLSACGGRTRVSRPVLEEHTGRH